MGTDLWPGFSSRARERPGGDIDTPVVSPEQAVGPAMMPT